MLLAPTERLIPWSMVYLTSNGTVGGNEYGCRQNESTGSQYCYASFSTSISYAYSTLQNVGSWREYYSPVPLILDRIDMPVMRSYRAVVGYQIDASLDGINYWTVASGTSNFNANPNASAIITDRRPCKYIKFIYTSASEQGLMMSAIIIAQQVK